MQAWPSRGLVFDEEIACAKGGPDQQRHPQLSGIGFQSQRPRDNWKLQEREEAKGERIEQRTKQGEDKRRLEAEGRAVDSWIRDRKGGR